MEKMREEKIQQVIESLKLERVDSYGARGKIISRWKLKTLLSGVEIDLGDASANIKKAIGNICPKRKKNLPPKSQRSNNHQVFVRN